MYKRFILIIGILLLLGVISCSLVKEKTYNIKIVNIPKNIPTSSFNNIRNIIIEYLTYEPLHTLNSSLLDEIHFQDNKLICKLKKGIYLHNGFPLTSKQVVKNNNYGLEIKAISPLQFDIKYSVQQRAKLDSFFHNPVTFYSRKKTNENPNLFIGTGKYYLSNITKNKITIKRFTYHRDNKENQYDNINIFWNQEAHFDEKISFENLKNNKFYFSN